MVSKRLETAKKYISHFETLDIPVLDSVLAENYTHEFAPASLNPPGPFDKQGKLDHIGRLRNVLSGFPVTAKEYVESESSNQVTIWATSRTIFHDDLRDDGIPQEDWMYQGEYIFLLFMNETGEKIVRITEFLDSKGTTDKLYPLIKRATQNKENKLVAT